MTDEPERIWVEDERPLGGGVYVWNDCNLSSEESKKYAVEYIRADLVAALETEITYPDFIHSILCDVQDYNTSLYDCARAVSSEIRRAFRAALRSTEEGNK